MIHYTHIKHLVDYTQMLEHMKYTVEQMINLKKNLKVDQIDEYIFILQHYDVYTLGYNSKTEDILVDNLHIPVIQTNRGGMITYHGPGQLVIYPIIDLTNRVQDLRWYIQSLAQIVINLCKYLNIQAFSDDKNVGVWVLNNNIKQKIASIGIRVKKWITYHGISININPNMSNFKIIKPCGFDGSIMTSLWELGVKIDYSEILQIIRYELYKLLC